MEEAVSTGYESSVSATLMVHVHQFERCHDCTAEAFLDAILSADLIIDFEKQRIQEEKGRVERNR